MIFVGILAGASVWYSQIQWPYLRLQSLDIDWNSTFQESHKVCGIGNRLSKEVTQIVDRDVFCFSLDGGRNTFFFHLFLIEPLIDELKWFIMIRWESEWFSVVQVWFIEHKSSELSAFILFTILALLSQQHIYRRWGNLIVLGAKGDTNNKTYYRALSSSILENTDTTNIAIIHVREKSKNKFVEINAIMAKRNNDLLFVLHWFWGKTKPKWKIRSENSLVSGGRMCTISLFLNSRPSPIGKCQKDHDEGKVHKQQWTWPFVFFRVFFSISATLCRLCDKRWMKSKQT